jgi:hypothetical protein
LRFQQYGRTYQLHVESAADLEQLLGMDETLWVATSAPVSAFRCDTKFLAMLDADANGRICSDELKAAIRWLFAHLADSSRIADGIDALPLTVLKGDTPEGQALVDSARYVLSGLADVPQDIISLPQVRAFLATIQSRPLNGDGVIIPASTDDPQVAAFLRAAVTATGGSPDLSGAVGVNEAQINAFLAAAQAYLAWRELGDVPEGETATTTMPLGADTPALYALYSLHADKVDLFFDLCRLGAFDPRTASRLPGLDSNLQQLDPVDPAQVSAYLAKLPMAVPAPHRELPLVVAADINPIYRTWLRDMQEKVFPRVPFGGAGDTLSEDEWLRVKAAFQPYEAYLAQKAGAIAESFPLETLRSFLDPMFREETQRLLEADRRVAAIVRQTEQVERLLLCHRHLLPLTNNFVSFPYLYSTDSRALFEMGSTVMDGRRLTFAVKVENVAEHLAIAKLSNLFVVYLEVTGAANEKFNVAVPVTSGTKGNLGVGKRGVFFDIHGKEYDARVIQVVENPVSLREALAMPFVRLWRILEGRIETWSTSAEKSLETEFGKALPSTPGAAPAPAAASANQLQPRSAGGAFMGLAFVTAALGSAFAFVTKTFASMGRQQILLSLAVAVGVVILPITLVAFLKLRRQDLSSILEGCGWAINARMRLDRKQRHHFTRAYAYPKGSEGTPRHTRLKLFAIVLALELAIWGALAWYNTGPLPSEDPGVVPARQTQASVSKPPADRGPATPAGSSQ